MLLESSKQPKQPVTDEKTLQRDGRKTLKFQ